MYNEWYTENVWRNGTLNCTIKWLTENVRRNGIMKMYDEMVH